VFLRKQEKGKTLLCAIAFNVQLHCNYLYHLQLHYS